MGIASYIINKVLPVQLTGSIPAGSNEIGKVKLTDGTDTLVVNVDGSANVQLTGRNAQTIKTHNAVSVPASSSSLSATFIDANGFDRLALTQMINVASASQMQILWSNDGVIVHGTENSPAMTSQYAVYETPIKARYFKLYLINSDAAAAHTMSAWAYLKA